jgi:hypothetical protein
MKNPMIRLLAVILATLLLCIALPMPAYAADDVSPADKNELPWNKTHGSVCCPR